VLDGLENVPGGFDQFVSGLFASGLVLSVLLEDSEGLNVEMEERQSVARGLSLGAVSESDDGSIGLSISEVQFNFTVDDWGDNNLLVHSGSGVGLGEGNHDTHGGDGLGVNSWSDIG